MTDDPDADNHALAQRMALANAAHWLQTRMGLDAASARFAAKEALSILYPYTLLSAYSEIAEGLHAAGFPEVATGVEQTRHEWLTRLTQHEE